MNADYIQKQVRENHCAWLRIIVIIVEDGTWEEKISEGYTKNFEE